MIQALRELAQELGIKGNGVLVDFCSGSGQLAFAAAWAMNSVWKEVVLVEKNPVHASRARIRARDSGLDRKVRVVEKSIEEFGEPFDVGSAVHACGSLSDIVLDKCIEKQASFLLCPCCVGKISPSVRNCTYPRSTAFKTVLSEAEYLSVAKAGDFGESETESGGPKRLCKSLIEWDRLLSVQEHGYRTRFLRMDPLSCSPKNDIILGTADFTLTRMQL
jgi:hypothetical protein